MAAVSGECKLNEVTIIASIMSIANITNATNIAITSIVGQIWWVLVT